MVVGDEPVAAGFFMLKNFYEKTNQIECVFRFWLIGAWH